MLSRQVRRSGLSVLLSLALLTGVAAPPPVNGGHTIQSGDCWRSGTPFLCRTTWNPTQRVVNLELYNQFTHLKPGWLDNAETACNNWHDFVIHSTNDIWCHWAPNGGGQSPVYLKTAVDGQHGLVSGLVAMTWNCNTSGVCTNQATALNIYYSEIYFNTSGEMDALSETKQNWAFAHEIGHSLGLFHHNTSTYLMNQSAVSVSGPTANDYGSLPACSGASTTYGVRCIYHFSF